MNIVCRSVVGGWQSFDEDSGLLFGPVYNKVNDLWEWQRYNVEEGMKVVKNLMSGEAVLISEDTPWCCRPDSETFWSM